MNKKIIAVFAIVGIIVVPSIINWVGTNIALKSGANFGDWLGFWGSYLGGIITLFGVYLAFYLEQKRWVRERILEKSETVSSAKLWCLTILTSDPEHLLDSRRIEKLLERLDEFHLEIRTIDREFHALIHQISVIMATLYASLRPREDGEVGEEKAKKKYLELKEKVEELLYLIEKTEGNFMYVNMLKDKKGT